MLHIRPLANTAVVAHLPVRRNRSVRTVRTSRRRCVGLRSGRARLTHNPTGAIQTGSACLTARLRRRRLLPWITRKTPRASTGAVVARGTGYANSVPRVGLLPCAAVAAQFPIARNGPIGTAGTARCCCIRLRPGRADLTHRSTGAVQTGRTRLAARLGRRRFLPWVTRKTAGARTGAVVARHA